MIYIVSALLAVAVGYLGIRLFLLKKSLKEASAQLREINRNLQENRTMKLSAPDKEVEELLEDINQSLQGIRAEKVAFLKREKEFKQQIENISHDLRTPLTSMIGYLRIMDISGLPKEEQEDLQTVLKKAERLQELIAEFYDFSRLSAGEYGLVMERMDVAKALRTALADGYGDLSLRELAVTAEIPEVQQYILGDDSALQRVFQNLLQNAGKYAESSLKVSLGEDEKEICVCFQNDVRDLGPRDAERLFERFYTQDKSRNSGSTGLGLTIAKEFVEQMGGRITAEVEGGILCISLRFKREV